MNFSFWEKQSFLNGINFGIVGSGIVGLSAAIELKKRFPNKRTVVFERGMLPSGASTKNAGFACFGSPSEILDDLKIMSKDEVLNLVEKRWKGLLNLKQLLGDQAMDFQLNRGFELFSEKDSNIFRECESHLEILNDFLKPIFKENVYSLENEAINCFGFNNISNIISNKFEGQINTGMMMTNLILLAKELGVEIINGAEILNFEDNKNSVSLIFGQDKVEVEKLIIANNGFAKSLLPELDVKPARAQVLITKPIPNLKIKGVFHYDKGYYYFRNVGDRVLFGGGRNLDFEGETTTQMQTSELIQNRLEQMLSEIILPNQSFEIEQRWAGIMGVGSTKKTIVKHTSENVVCAVRMGGMGVAIGSLVGKEAAELI